MQAKEYVVVIGGMNLDIAGLCGDIYRERDSNIGNIQMTMGGVGQNIAQNLVKLEVPTYFIGVYGDDYFGNILATECEKLNIRLDYAQCINGEKSSSYLYITDDKGEMVTAINDMKITEYMTPQFFKSRIDFINHAAICMIDGNVPKESIEWLANHCTVPIFVDPVSIVKVSRFENILDKIDSFKPNELEASFLTRVNIVDEETAREAAIILNQKGIKNVFISMGANGMLCARDGETRKVDILPSRIISVNGAGDCSMAAIIWARFFYKGSISLEETAQLAQAASSLTVEVSQSVSPNLCIEAIKIRAKNYLREV